MSEPTLPNLVLGPAGRRGAGRPDPKYDWGPDEPTPLLGAPSAAKHEVQERYLGRYLDTVTSHHSQTALNLIIIDGFCGGGLYTFEGREAEGSPLRMLRVVDAAQERLAEARTRGFEIKCDFVFVDQNRHHLDYLEQLLKRRGHGDRIGRDIRLVNSTFEEAAPSIIQGIRRKGTAHRSLFFLDQDGWSSVAFSTVRDIMSGLVNPEVILTFMVDALINLLHEESSLQALARIDLARGDVQEVLRERGKPGWKRVIQNTLYRHIQDHTAARFYSPFYIHPPESHRDYWPIHLSKHHAAREEMGKTFWDVQNTMEHLGGPALDALGFDPDVDVRQGALDYVFEDDAKKRSIDELMRQVPRLLHRLGQDGRPVTRRDLFAGRANDAPVVAGMLDQTLSVMRDSGDVTVRGWKKAGDGALLPTARRTASAFAWNDQFTLTPQPALFMMPRAKKPPIAA